jgi:inner membrane protein
MAPDLDIFIPTFGDPTASWYWHRGPTHALVFVPIGALLCLVPFLWSQTVRQHWKWALAACFVGFLSHGPLDALTSYGTMLFWPFADTRVALDWMPIIDPLWTLPVLLGVVVAAIARRAWVSRAVLTYGLLYFAFGALQNHRALEATREVARARGHEPVDIRAMPSPLALIVWRGLYTHDGQAWPVGVRVGYVGGVTTTAEARTESRPLAQIEAFSSDAEAQRHFQVFDWFAGDYAVPADPGDPTKVIDARYSLDPAGFSPLWGLLIEDGVVQRYEPPVSFDRANLFDTMLGDDPEYR